MDWQSLEKKKVEPPFKPRLTGDMDLTNIDRVRLPNSSDSYFSYSKWLTHYVGFYERSSLGNSG